MRENPKPYEQFMHFKGKRYQIINIAKHSETREDYVVYQALYGDYGVYIRPLNMFMSEVDHVKYPHVKQKYRFTRVVNEHFIEEDPSYRLPEGEITPQAVTEKKDDEVIGERVVPNADLLSDEMKAVVKEPVPSKETELAPKVNSKGLTSEEEKLDPLLLQFLDATTTEDRLNILTGLHSRITDEMITTIAIVMDVDVPNGDLEERYDQIRFALLAKKKYEGTRLR